MAKKKFSTGLDSLFDHSTYEDELQKDAPQKPLEDTPEDGNDLLPPPGGSRRSASKNFTSDLDSLFQDALTNAAEAAVQKMRKETGEQTPEEEEVQRRYKKPLSGLDALIRQTSDTQLTALEQAPVKRVTFVFENAKIEKLKNIARREKSFLKDLVQGVITEFINNYEQRKGAI